jgi:hypothetical protein
MKEYGLRSILQTSDGFVASIERGWLPDRGPFDIEVNIGQAVHVNDSLVLCLKATDITTSLSEFSTVRPTKRSHRSERVVLQKCLSSSK